MGKIPRWTITTHRGPFRRLPEDAEPGLPACLLPRPRHALGRPAHRTAAPSPPWSRCLTQALQWKWRVPVSAPYPIIPLHGICWFVPFLERDLPQSWNSAYRLPHIPKRTRQALTRLWAAARPAVGASPDPRAAPARRLLSCWVTLGTFLLVFSFVKWRSHYLTLQMTEHTQPCLNQHQESGLQTVRFMEAEPPTRSTLWFTFTSSVLTLLGSNFMFLEKPFLEQIPEFWLFHVTEARKCKQQSLPGRPDFSPPRRPSHK